MEVKQINKVIILLSLVIVLFSCKKEQESLNENQMSTIDDSQVDQTDVFDEQLLKSHIWAKSKFSSQNYFCSSPNIKYGSESNSAPIQPENMNRFVFSDNGELYKEPYVGGTILTSSWSLSEDGKTLYLDDIISYEFTLISMDENGMIMIGSTQNDICGNPGNDHFSIERWELIAE